MLSAAAAPSIVRFRIACPDLAEYQARLASEYELNGVFIPQARVRPRPVGSRVLLKIELGDRSLAYSGDAVVAAHVLEPGRAGFILNLEAPREREAPATPDGVTEGIDLPAPRRAALTDAIFDDEPAPPPPEAEPAPAAFVGVDDVTVELPPPAPEPEAAAPGRLSPADAELLGLTPTPLVVRNEVPLRLRPTPRPEPAGAPAETPAATPGQLPLPRSRRSRRIAVAGIAAGLALAAAGLVLRGQRNAAVVEVAFADAIRVADERIQAGRLTVPAGDSALDHLLTARGLLPRDGRVTSRLEVLADTLDALGRRAAARDDFQEAAAHLSGALRADPGRQRTRAALEGVEARRRDQETRQHDQDGNRRRGRRAGAGAAG